MAKKMSPLAITLIVIAVIVLFLIMWFVGTYNGLVRASESVDAQWANVETSYQRRIDLIPNLVATVQGAADFESETQTKIAELRTAATAAKANWDAATTQEAKLAAAQEMEGVASRFGGLNINVENYPQLKATENYLALQSQLEGTENRISVERTRYNEKVKEYNIRIKRIPTVIIANMFGYEKKNLFEATTEGAENAPDVGALLNQ